VRNQAPGPVISNVDLHEGHVKSLSGQPLASFPSVAGYDAANAARSQGWQDASADLVGLACYQNVI